MRRLLASLALLGAAAGHAQNFDDVTIASEQLADGVYMLTGAGGNLGLSVGPDGAFLVDDQYAPLSERITAAIGELTGQPVKFVFNTHWHYDHTGGNENLGKAGALIVAHDNVRERMSTEQFIEFFDRQQPPSPPGALPVVTFTDRVSFHLNGDDIHAIHIPHAHTDGDALVWFEQSNVLHMGDLFFHRMYPFIDLSSGGSIDGMIAGVNKGLSLANEQTRVIPGHGPLTDRAGLQGYRDMLVSVRDEVAELKAAGRSLEEAIAAGPTADHDEELSGGFIKPDALVTFIYNSLP